jgi:sugar/nucleoside kinase (ribokinase family)
MESQAELLCIGNAMVDVFARADEAAMDRLGLDEAVQHISSEEAERILRELGAGTGPAGEPVLEGGTGFRVSSGGGAANAAKTAALLDIKTAFIGAVGADGAGEFFRREIAGPGVSPLLVPAQGKTGLCIILSGPGGETRIAAAPGAAKELSPEHISEAAVQNAGVVVLDGYLMDRQPLVRRVLSLADRFGVPVALDAASVFQVRERTEEILQYSRNYPLIIFMNDDEAIAFYRALKKGSGEEKIRGEKEKADMIIREICPVLRIITGAELFPIFAVKMGGRGAVVVAGGEVYRAKTFPVAARNSIGAGDVFCAAFLAGWLRGRSVAESAALGNRTAREFLKAPGSRIPPRKLEPVKRALQKH